VAGSATELLTTGDAALAAGDCAAARAAFLERLPERTAQRPRRFATTERSRAATGSFEFLLTPRGAGTQVEIGMRLRPRGVMWLLQPLMRRMSTQFLAKLPDYVRTGLSSADQTA
jgi:hypothetical protein